jgi:single-strand DNA-binding protein
MNSVNITGRVGGEIEIRYTPSGKAVAQLTLAVDDGFGENKKTAWIGVTLWGATAECASKYVRKGDRLGISGRLSQEEWEDKATGKKQRKTKVTCENMHLLTDKRSDGGSPAPSEPPAPRRQPAGMPPAPAMDKFQDTEDDLPF